MLGSGLVGRLSYDEYIVIEKRTQGTETSQYLEEKTSTEIPLVVASERGPGQWPMRRQQKCLERHALAGDSPVCEIRSSVFE
jgi:hypothetical protein